MKNTLGNYCIVYKNGFIQNKYLIDHNYLPVIKKLQYYIDILEQKKKKRAVNKIKSIMSDMFSNNWFTNKSPLYNSIKTGVLILPDQQGGKHNIKITKIK